MAKKIAIETEETTEQAKAYVLRDLTADDVFPMFSIISKIGIKEFKNCFESDDLKVLASKVTSGKEASEADIAAIGVAVGFDLASVVISHLPQCKDDIYIFLSGLSGMTKAEVAKLPMVTFFEMIVDVFKKDEFKDFFGVAVKLLK